MVFQKEFPLKKSSANLLFTLFRYKFPEVFPVNFTNFSETAEWFPATPSVWFSQNFKFCRIPPNLKNVNDT